MLWVLFLLSILLTGFIINRVFFKKNKGILLLISSFSFGSLVAVWTVYFAAILLNKEVINGVVSYFLLFFILIFFQREQLKEFFLLFCQAVTNKKNYLFFLLFISFLFLFQRSLGYDLKNSQFLISSNLYQDMGAHIPFIRSFSLGGNFPAEVPFFAGKNLSYHFMFDLYTGIFEALGLELTFAFNVLSSISLTFLLTAIYQISNKIFKSSFVGFFSTVFFLFNSDLSFIDFIKQNKLSFSLLSQIWHNSSYQSLSLLSLPFSSFLNINVILNQRHLIFALLFMLVFLWTLLEINFKKFTREVVGLAVLIGLFPFWHMSVFVGIYLFLICYLIFSNKSRRQILLMIILSLIIALPQILLIKTGSVNTILFRPGFLIWNNLSLPSFILFWIYNLGLSAILLPTAIINSNKQQKQFFLLFLPLFIIPNLFQFSSDMFDNHKFFNMWIVVVNIFSAYAIYLIYKKNVTGKIISFILIFLLIFSGILNMFVVKNDVYVRIQDFPNNSLLKWAKNNILNNKLIFTNGEIYDPVSLIGKKVFLTRSHYVFLYGGDPSKRIVEKQTVLSGENILKVDQILHSGSIAYIILYKGSFAPNSYEFNRNILEMKYKKVYEDRYGVVIKI